MMYWQKELSEEEIKNKLERRISDMITRAVRTSPYWGTLFLSLERRFIPDRDVYAATDGRTLFYGAGLNEVSDSEMFFIMCHEVLHVVLDHPNRGQGKKCKKCWNIAVDLIVNEIIITAMKNGEYGGMTVPDGILRFKEHRDTTADRMYRTVVKDCPHERREGGDGVPRPEGEGGDGGPRPRPGRGKPRPGRGKPRPGRGVCPVPGTKGDWQFDDHLDPAKWSKEERKAFREWVKEVHKKAIRAQEDYNKKRGGKAPGNLSEMVSHDGEALLDWRDVLAAFMGSIPGTWTYMPPDRRFIGRDFYVPSFLGPVKVPANVVFAVDTSLSMSAKELGIYVAEIQSLLESFPHVIAPLIMCDTRITKILDLKKDIDTDELAEVLGRGGTEYYPVFDWIMENAPSVLGLIYITDGMPADWPPEPYFRVIWVLTKRVSEDKIPYGDVLYHETAQ